MRGQEELKTNSRVFGLSNRKEEWSLAEVEKIIGKADKSGVEV